MPAMSKAELRDCILAHLKHPRVMYEDWADDIMDHIDDYERSQWRPCSEPPEDERKVLYNRGRLDDPCIAKYVDGHWYEMTSWRHIASEAGHRWRDLPTYQSETTPPRGSVNE